MALLPFFTSTVPNQHDDLGAENTFNKCVHGCPSGIELRGLREKSGPKFLLKIRLFMSSKSRTAG